MKVIASTDEYTIYQRRDNRYAVQDAKKRPINGDEKIAILLKHELIVAAAPKAPEPEVEESAEAEAPAEAAAAEDSAEASADEEPAAAEDSPAQDAADDAAGAEEDKS